VDGLEDDQGLYDVHEISAHRRGKGRNANKWLFLTSWTGYFYPRDQDWYPPSCFVTDDFINTVFQDYVIANNLPADLLDSKKVKLLSGPAPQPAKQPKEQDADAKHFTVLLTTTPPEQQLGFR
jgi:hypothetical protein